MNEAEKDALLKNIGSRVRALRNSANLSVRELAGRAELSLRFLTQLESGKGNISVAGLARVAAVLGRPIAELIPPSATDQSLRAQLWRILSLASDEDILEFTDWFQKRTGAPPKPFVALVGLR